VIAWLLLPKDQGYWFNSANADQVQARFQALMDWTIRNDLVWDGVGIDIGPDIREFKRLTGKDRFKSSGRVWRRALQHRKYYAARRKYLDLIESIRSAGWKVDGYQFPIIADERKARSTLLQRLAGMIDLPVDREVWMLLSSFLGANGSGLLGSYGPEAPAIAVGSTGGAARLDPGDDRSLTWVELARDLRLAWYWQDDIYIFSLEGCVRQNFIPRLKAFVWDKPILLPDLPTERVNAWRGLLQTSLWISAHLSTVIIGLLAVWWAILRLLRILRSRK